jgi:hypothetical protein
VNAEVPAGLLLDVQRRLESLYALDPEAPVTDFVIPEEEAAAYPGGGSRTLVKDDGGAVSVGVILDGGVCSDLARSDPRVKLSVANLGSFCILTEEVSHFLYLLFCARRDRRVSQLELELQAEVDKYLAAVLFLSLQNEGAVSSSLRHYLFRRWRLAGGVSAERAERYRTASALAERYCAHLEARFLKRGRLTELARETRRFYRLAQREKLETIAEIRWA